MYSFNLENIVPLGGLACLIAKATTDESNLWHRRLGHVNFKNLNRLVKGNLVRGLPTKLFQNDHTCVACQKGKQHKASCKAKTAMPELHNKMELLRKEQRPLIEAAWPSLQIHFVISDQDCFELPIWHSYSSTKKGGPREEEQVFLDDLARLQWQERKLMRKLKLSEES
ncbi:putative ribonuclease H-like domain-containing protein [Tanacetum coccineum]